VAHAESANAVANTPNDLINADLVVKKHAASKPTECRCDELECSCLEKKIWRHRSYSFNLIVGKKDVKNLKP
jgi:hypothetical protein